MEGKPLVSVILPVYNREKYLGMAIESVLAQTYDKLELIIVDDGSSDHSPEVIQRHAQKDQRVRFAIHESNRGVSAAKDITLFTKGRDAPKSNGF